MLLMLDVYAAGEAGIPGADSRSLCGSIRQRGKVDPIYVENDSEVQLVLNDVLRDGDIVITQGAGSVGALARKLSSEGLVIDER